jgi:uncharacterized protein (TIGR02246 family)
MKILLIAASLLLVAFPASSTTSTQQDAKTVEAVRALLDAQVLAWNRGDMEAFMNGYWRSSETVFVSGDIVTRGWQDMLDRYKKHYYSREKVGTLAFSDLEITVIGPDAAVAFGRWQFTVANDSPHGRFTLIFRRTPQGWRIVHDHTSTAS